MEVTTASDALETFVGVVNHELATAALFGSRTVFYMVFGMSGGGSGWTSVG